MRNIFGASYDHAVYFIILVLNSVKSVLDW